MAGPIDDSPRWGDDNLTSFFVKSQNNRMATYSTLHEESLELVSLDAALRNFWPGLLDPPSVVAADLLARAHVLFTSASEMAFATQQYSAIVIARSALECAGYANLIMADSTAEQIWLARNDSRTKRDKARSKFTIGAVKASLGIHSAELSDIYMRLYETSIEFGAHPNLSGIVIGSKHTNLQDSIRMEQIGLTDNLDLISFGMKTVFDVGFCICGVITYCLAQYESAQKLSLELSIILDKHNSRLKALES